MNTTVIQECVTLSLANKISFPEVIKKLISVHVERYIADLVGRTVHYFSNNNEIYSLPLEIEAAQVAKDFDAAAVSQAVRASQQKQIDYPTFLSRVIAAGCSHYEVYITGKKVIYFGRDGSLHIEHFPQAKQ